MAKKDKKKRDRTDASWMNTMGIPSQKEYRQYLASQQRQYNPLINLLGAQLRDTRNIGKDPVVQAYERMAGALPTEAAVSARYQQGLQNLAGFMKDVNVARGGQGVSSAVQGIAGAIGADAGTAADVAGTAGAVSGVGGGQDILSQALLGGAAAQFANVEAQRLGEISGQRQQFQMGAAEARKAAKTQRQELARMMAEAKGQRIGARVNPFDIASQIMSFQQARKAMMGGGRGGSGGASTGRGGRGGGGSGQSAEETKYRKDIIASGLEGLITPTPDTEAASGSNPYWASGKGYNVPSGWTPGSGQTLNEYNAQAASNKYKAGGLRAGMARGNR